MKNLLLMLSAPLCLTLAACGAQVVSTTDKTVVIQARKQDREKALDLAEGECQKHGLHARLTGRTEDERFVYDCVR